MEKKWVKIDERYEVSNDGEVKSVARYTKFGNCKTDKILKPQLLGKYLAVYIYNRETKKMKWEYVARLVAKAFVPNPDNLPEVNHKNENKLDNRAENLEWCNRRYNNTYGTARSRAYETKVATGKYQDLRGMTKEEKYQKQKERQKERRKETYVPKKKHYYIYVSSGNSYVEVAEYVGLKNTAAALQKTTSTIYKAVKKDWPKNIVEKKYYVSTKKMNFL